MYRTRVFVRNVDLAQVARRMHSSGQRYRFQLTGPKIRYLTDWIYGTVENAICIALQKSQSINNTSDTS